MKDKLAFYVGEDKELSVVLQKLLFKLGYRWTSGGTEEQFFPNHFGPYWIIADTETKDITWNPNFSSVYKDVAWVRPKEEEDLYLTIFNEKDGKRNIIKLNLPRARELGLID